MSLSPSSGLFTPWFPRSEHASQGLDAQYDFIMTSVVVHDAADPLGLMTAIRKALKPGGTYLCGEPEHGEKVEDNVGPRHAVLYGGSIFYCLTTSLVNNGVGLGTLGLPDSKFREFTEKAGFGSVRRLDLDPKGCIYLLDL